MSEVPIKYWGLWRRALLEQAGLADTSTQVWWLQTPIWHADLRIPAGRPSFLGVTGLEECNRAQLEWLLQQEGFAGVTAVERETCTWVRRFDYRPSGCADVARMLFRGDVIEETGVLHNYFERWERVPRTEMPVSAQCLVGKGLKRLLLCAGEFFMYVRPPEKPLDAHWSKHQLGVADEDDMRVIADFEISLGQVVGGSWEVLHSTCPWREGHSFKPSGSWKSLDSEILE